MSGFVHDALLYAGDSGFLAGVAPFVRSGIDTGETVLVAVSAPRIELLRDELGSDAEAVRFADMSEIGRNPACIIPVWRDLVAEAKVARGVGEPVYPQRRADELEECRRHEALLNVAFADAPAFRLLCPYDVEALNPESVQAARCTHPRIVQGGEVRPSTCYLEPEQLLAGNDALPPPPTGAQTMPFTIDELSVVRELVARMAAAAGLNHERTADAVLAVSELAANSVRYGGGRGTLTIWTDRDALLCEVADAGRIEDVLVGRRRPSPRQAGGRGLWIVNQVCDLVQLRSGPGGTRVRVQLVAAARLPLSAA